ncbi:Uncharacterised protein [Mycobacterium tuberculosis]|nr:Uncharacterised protein [Mycobacterium tuberculosis]
MRVGVGAGLEYLGAEFVAHENIAVQRDLHAARTASDPVAHLQHRPAVGREMQIRTTDSARSDPHQHLTGTGHRLGYVVAVDHTPVTQH